MEIALLGIANHSDMRGEGTMSKRKKGRKGRVERPRIKRVVHGEVAGVDTEIVGLWYTTAVQALSTLGLLTYDPASGCLAPMVQKRRLSPELLCMMTLGDENGLRGLALAGKAAAEADGGAVGLMRAMPVETHEASEQVH